MKKLETLTKEQESRFPEFIKKWTDIGLSTKKANRKEAEEGINEMYSIAGLKNPKIVWCDSPLSQGLTRHIIQKMESDGTIKKFVGENKEKSVGASVRDSVWDSVGASVRDSVWASVGDSVWASVGDSVGASVGASVRASVGDSVGASVRDSVWASVGDSVWASVWASVRDSVGDSVRASVRDSVWASVWDSVWASVGDSVGASVRASVRDSVWASVWASVGDSVGASVGASGYGQHDANWLAFYDFFKEVCGLDKETQKLSGLWKVSKNAGWFLPHENICWVSERHIELHRDEEGRLHSDQVMALKYPDNWGIYALDGVRLPEELWKKIISKEMTLSEIMKIEISDQRTVALKYNPQAIIKENAKLIHKDERNNELYLVENSEINRLTFFPKMYFLKMLCPTGRVFIEGVPPEEAEKSPNATDMQALLCGLTKSEYMEMKLES